MSILEIKNLSIFYKDKMVIEEMNLDIKERTLTCIMGSSGSGKTSVLSAINGFLKSEGGRYIGDIMLEGKNIKDLNLPELRKNISTLFQDSKPFNLSIEKNILYGLTYHGVKDKKAKMLEILKEVNLYEEVKGRLNRPARELSGGQKQRLCIARLLTTNPKIIIFDEPCSSLDLENTLIIEDLLMKLKKKYTIIVSTHNKDQSERIADKIIYIEDKKMNLEYTKNK